MISQNETCGNYYGLPVPQEKLSSRKMKSSSSMRNASWNVDTRTKNLDDQHLTKEKCRCDEVCSRKRNRFEASNRNLLGKFDDDMQKLLRLLRSTDFVGQVDRRYHSQYHVPSEKGANSGVTGSVQVTTIGSGSSKPAKKVSFNEEDFGSPRHWRRNSPV
jgi:hypothetical protein